MKTIKLITLSFLSCFYSVTFAENKTHNLQVNAITNPGCVIIADDVHFGVIEFTPEMIHSGNRVLFEKTLNVQYQCTPGVAGVINSTGLRNIYNTLDNSQYFHFDTTYKNSGIHTIPFKFTSTGLLQEVPIEIKIMNPSDFGNGVLPLAGNYVGNFNLNLVF